MNHKNQALRLAQMMLHNEHEVFKYELSLPLVEVSRSKLKKLSAEDVLLLGFKSLLFVLVHNRTIYASAVLNRTYMHQYLKIVDLESTPLSVDEGKKHIPIRLSFGALQCRKLEVGYRVDMTHRSFEKVDVLVDENKYASGHLVNVDGRLAVKIDKVER